MTDPEYMIDKDAILRYLDLIYPAEFGWTGAVSLSYLRPGWLGMPSASYDRSDVEGILSFARQAARAGAPGTYLRCSTLARSVPSSRRGRLDESVEIPGLWSDIDIEGPGHKHDPSRHGGLVLPRDVDQALEIVGVSGLPQPTLIVHSGGGLYAWWCAREVIDVTDPTERVRWGRVSAWWQEQLRVGAASLGLHYGTGVGNLDRILGLAGTVNGKILGDPKWRYILEYDGTRYAPEDLDPGGLEIQAHDDEKTPTVYAHRRAPEDIDISNGPITASALADAAHVSPFEAFEAKNSWKDILEPLHWEIVRESDEGYIEWRRPGASHPISATTGRAQDRDRMWVFSDAAGLPANEPLTKGFVYARLWHGGDMSTAASVLQDLGYGPPRRVNGSQRALKTPRSDEDSPEHLHLTCASSLRMRAAEWLWEELGATLVPLGGLTLVSGREGTGKSTFVIRIASQLTRGELPGDLHGQPRDVIISAKEDDWEYTLIPRLTASGADLSRVHRIDSGTDESSGLTLPTHFGELRQILIKHPDVALMILDPILSVLGGGLDSHKDAEVRTALEPVVRLAHDRGVTMIGLIHENKSSGTDLLTRIMGSRAWPAVARAVLSCREEKDTPDPSEVDEIGADPVEPSPERDPLPASALDAPVTFLLGQTKSNLGAKVRWSIRYRIAPVTLGVDPDNGKPIRTSRTVRIGRHRQSLEDAVRAQEAQGGGRQPTRRQEAQEALLEALSGEERARGEVFAELIEDGHSLATIKRALAELRKRGEVTVTKGGYKNTEVYLSLSDKLDHSRAGGVTRDPTDPTDPTSVMSVMDNKLDQLDQLDQGSGTPREGDPALLSDSPISPCSCPDGLIAPWCALHAHKAS